MAWCLTPDGKKKLLEALKRDGDAQKMVDRGSEGRIAFLSEFVGEVNAKEINALFESKMLLKNQIEGFISFAKRIGGREYVKKDFISKVKNLDKALSKKEVDQYLESYVSKRLGLDMPEQQYKDLQRAYTKIETTKASWEKELEKHPEWKKTSSKKHWLKNETRLKYGFAKVDMENYVNNLKLEAKSISFRARPVEHLARSLASIPGTAKSFLASLDNSFWGRQGLKVLTDWKTTDIWVNNFIKSFSNIKNQLLAKGGFWKAGDDKVMDLIKADIYSRPNAMNGKYEVGRYGLGVLNEEAYPSSVPEKIPALGRLFKASEVAYNAGALQLRADLADRLIDLAEKNGVNTLDRIEAKGMGRLVSSMTGRGDLGKAESFSKELNVIAFSAKFVKGTIDTLIAPIKYAYEKGRQKVTGQGIEAEFAKKEAAKSTLRILTTLGIILATAKILNPDSVDEDPRSTNFGKIKIFGKWTDITGGMASIQRLVARTMIPTKHNGKWGLWSKSSTGNWTNLLSGEYGSRNALEVIESFFENKASPMAGLIRDMLKGKNFEGEPVTLKNALEGLTIPISIQNYNDLKDDPNADWVLGSMILEGFGFSVSTYSYKANWGTSTSKELKQFKDEVGNEDFNKANDDYNRAYNFIINGLENDKDYKKLSDDAKASVRTKIRSNVKEKIFDEYGFKYEKEEKTEKEKDDDETIKDIMNSL